MSLLSIPSDRLLEPSVVRNTHARQATTDQESLRILRVAQSTYPDVIGGADIHIDRLSRNQAELGHEVTVLTSDNGDQSLPREEQRDGYRLVRHREFGRPFDNSIAPGIFRTVRDLVSAHDVLHVHSHLYFSSNVAALLGRVTDIPVVVTNHGLISQTAPGWVQTAFNLTLGKFTFEAADRILCYTETDKLRLRERGIESEISVIHNGIDCARFKPNGVEPKPELLFVGRLKKGKGPQYLIDAFAELAPAYPDLTVKLVGDGPIRANLEKQSESLGISDRVTFLGEVSNDELPALYNDSLAFVLPSLSEGLPRTVLEAMACETPVVVTELEQLKPVVKGAGATVEPKSPDQIVQAISALLEDDDLRRELGKTGRRRVNSSYTWEQTVNKTIASYYDTV